VAWVLALGVVVLAGCTKDANSVAEQALAGDGKGYVAGDGTVQQIAPAQRATTVALAGTTVDGKTWSMTTDARDKVVVVNVWGSWCGPCVEETPRLQQVWSTYEKAGKPVAFVGVAIKESAVNSAQFLSREGVTYPSLSDGASGGQPMLALQGKAAATPSTLVLDRQGRIAARVLGVTTAATLTALVDDVLAERA
jgi:thiol-disulfide isomerase/thioredoxin